MLSKALGAGLLAIAAAVGLNAVPAAAATTPGTGFVSGTDSFLMPVTGSGTYKEPVLGNNYGGYIGMAGSWARTEGCKTGNQLAWAPANANQANANFQKYGYGVGTGVYWYMAGPGVDPHYDGGTTEAYRWGQQQAADAFAAVKGRFLPYAVMWADIETPEIAPARDNGWNSVYTSPCSGVVKQAYVPAVLDRSVFNGFAAYVTSHSKFKVGVYSAPEIWNSIFGTNSKYSALSNTYEWTYLNATKNVADAPSGWCLRGGAGCATFFGGQTSSSKYAVAWQWSGGGGFYNGVGDFDQIDVARLK